MYQPKTYTVESVASGHPDKVCDQISDAILDACLVQDPQTRAGVETFGSNDLLVIGGEITTNADVDYEAIARKVYADLGYVDNLRVIPHINTQSADIALGVNIGGAGDQGIMYGFATDETNEYMPKTVVQVHQLARKLEEVRRAGVLDWLLPDGKAQITVINDRISSVLVSTQHKSVSQDEIRAGVIEYIIKPVIGDIEGLEILVNPTGKFEKGGFEADAGLTGRKIMVDTYCGLAPHGGGAFSGKDPTKVDRSAAYMARFAAKNLVAQGLAKKCLVSVAYAIGRVEPLMVDAIDENGKGMGEILKKQFDFRPAAIIERLNLRSPVFQKTAAYGHFGYPGRSWENLVF
ncbi:MAG: methionine adenosyltransferase [Candidatus Harrisonbacteria bacterium CG10_big_fil_rev_8_21_14_0_10_45_28]|uniref:Methionine adenosyltransferase n=1 Tax=Candidatus Harrisonbacteria bacterium CG10_big_fil_rev_8_21_14_0_10_45_28 TaxID=1974586 RepID=A0A2H0UMM7_9BACT|nr:MAG: methionine adenosyltransferase [Candidatus Harrisonbacteria bacterium CG10_big_fil_rev_8_21_14_0_10_45_28]